MQFHHLRRDALLPTLEVARAVAIGVGVGVVAAMFRQIVEHGVQLRTMILEQVRNHHDLTESVLAIGGLGLLLCALLAGVAHVIRRHAPETAGSGVQEVEAALEGKRPIRSLRVLLFKFSGGVVALVSGLALGREGPTIQMGAALGNALVRPDASDQLTAGRQISIAAGAAAGLAAAFNAPLSGLLLVLEEMRSQFRFSSRGLQFVLIATLCADIVVRMMMGNAPVIDVGQYHAPSLDATGVFLGLGLLCGGVGVIFNRLLLSAIDTLSPRRRGLLWPVAWGLIAAPLLVYLPQTMGDGYSLVPAAEKGDWASGWLLLLVAARMGTTMLSFSCGVPGGIFAPLVSSGLLMGCALAPWVRAGGFEVTNLQLALAAVGGLFAATVQAPLTGVVLAIELTGKLDASLSLLAATTAASLIARVTKTPPIYESLAQRLPVLNEDDNEV